MSDKLYQLFCDNCSYKKITDGTDLQKLQEVKTSPIPRGTPQIDPVAPKKTIPVQGSPAMNVSNIIQPLAARQAKRFKCPKCGRVIMARQIVKTEHDPDVKS